MADQDSADQNAPAGDGQGNIDPEKLPQLRILAQYIKDLSFENPSAPNSLAGGQGSPQIDVSVDVKAGKRTSDEFEVDLSISVSAKRGEMTAFIVELVYGGVFKLMNVPQDKQQPIVLIECPRQIFPFARRVIADVTRDGGFPPLMLDPIDFGALFQRQLADQQAKNADGASASVATH